MIRQHNHYHLWKLVTKLEWRLFKKKKVWPLEQRGRDFPNSLI